MHMFNDMQRKVQEFASENASTLLTAGGVVGTVATAVLAGRAGAKAVVSIEQERFEMLSREHGEEVDEWLEKAEAGAPRGKRGQLPNMPEPSFQRKLIVAGPQFIPPVITGATTITAIVMANRMSAQKAAALAAAYGLTQGQFEEYKAKVAEKLTGPKQEQVDTELAQERANRAQGAGQIVIVEGGDVLCFDQATGRYFKSTMEKIKRAENRTNEEALNGEYASANFFYEELGLAPTTWGEEVGFNRDNLVKLDISTIISPEDRSTPCLAINFKNMPTEDYIRKVYE